MELIVTILRYALEFGLQFISWLVGLMFEECANWIRRKFLFNLNDIIITKESIEFQFKKFGNLVVIKYSIENRTPYSFKIIGIKGKLNIFSTDITSINQVEYAIASVRKNTEIIIEHNLNEFETNRIKELKGDHAALIAKFTATHIIARTGDNLAFSKTINYDTATVKS